MSLELLKRATIAAYLRLLLRRQDALTAEVKKIADTLDLFLKLECVTRGIPLSGLKERAELLSLSKEVEKKVGERSAKSPMELLNQTPEEIERLDRAYEHAEHRLGKGNVPLSLDLYAEAEKLDPSNPDETP